MARPKPCSKDPSAARGRALVAVAVAVAAALTALLLPTAAWALAGDTQAAFGLDGSFRTLDTATVNYAYPPFFGEDNPVDGLSQSLLRLTAAGRPSPWFSYEAHGLQSLAYSTAARPAAGAGGALPTGLPASSSGDTRYRALDEAWDWIDEQDVQARLSLDRGNFKASMSRIDVTVGRQAITFGKAHFWNPLDVFLPFDALSIDRDYKPGVDAVRIDLATGSFSGLNLVAVAGRKVLPSGSFAPDEGGVLAASWYGSALLARAFGNVAGWDLAGQGGKAYGGYQIGAAAAGEIGPLDLRAEAAYLLASKSERMPVEPSLPEISDDLTAVAGLGHRFESSLVIDAEYFFNGSGEPDNLQAAAIRVARGDSLQMGRHLAGVVATYDILPILQGSLAWVFSFSDASTLIQPGLTLSVSDEASLLAGATIALGDRPTLAGGLQSEFGTYPSTFYLEFKLYF